MSEIKKSIKRVISDLEDGIFELEQAKDSLEEMKDQLYEAIEGAKEEKKLSLSNVLQWFESPFVADYDKKIVLEKFKGI